MSTSLKQEVAEWSKSTPIPLSRFELDAFPTNTFGGWLGEMVFAVADQLEAPIELPGMLGLAAIATAMQGKFSILIEDGYFEATNIWTAVAMEPSNRKSSALKSMIGPIDSEEIELARSLKPEIDQAKSHRETLEVIIRKRRQDAAKGDPTEVKARTDEICRLESELPEIPVYPRFLVNDCTPEQVAVLMREQSERISFIDSEADALFAMMLGRYSDSPQLDVYLKSYSADSIRVDRRNGPPILLKHPLITMGIAPQPGLIHDLAKKPLLIQRGLLSRFIFSVPKSLIGYRTLKARPVSDAVKLAYTVGLQRLLRIEAPEKPNIINLTTAAYQAWKDFQRGIETMMREDGRLHDSALKAWGGKCAGNTARVAGLLSAGCWEASDFQAKLQIDADTMDRAIGMMRVCIDHAIAVHDMARSDSGRSRAVQVLEWIRQKHQRSEVTVRDIQQSLKQRSDFQSAQDVREACDVLVDHGWLFVDPSEIDQPKRAGRKSIRYLVHPETYPQYPQKSLGGNSGDIGDVLRGQ